MDTNNTEITKIKVIGVGGGGGNTINRMVEMGIGGVELIAINTDKQALAFSKAHTLQIGEKATGGRGAGANPEVGRLAAEESKEQIDELLKDTQMVFITAGMGGGTGTGAAPLIAEAARSAGVLTVGVVTKPFKFEGNHRMAQAEAGIAKLAESVDSLIIIPNEKIKEVKEKDGEKITILNGFKKVDDVLVNGVNSITDLIVNRALINLDFADVTAVMKDGGRAHMGIGKSSEKNRAELAVKDAINNKLLETDIKGAKGVIICINGPVDLGLEEIDTAVSTVTEMADPNANIIFGANVDESNPENTEMTVTVIATGVDGAGKSLSSSPLGSFFAEAQAPSYPMDDISSSSSSFFGSEAEKKTEEFIDIINSGNN